VIILTKKKWEKIREEVGLTDLRFHDLRKTFGSLLAQNGIFTAITQKLLEHSSPNLTNKEYTNVDPVLRHAIEQLPVGDWLRRSSSPRRAALLADFAHKLLTM